MQLAHFAPANETNSPRLGAFVSGRILDLPAAANSLGFSLPGTVDELICAGESAWEKVRQAIGQMEAQVDNIPFAYSLEATRFFPPVLQPPSLRDFYAFEQHVRTAHEIRGRTVPPEWYRFPVFYFSNPSSLIGSGDPLIRPAYTQELDYELEVACVIGLGGRNLTPEAALTHVFGFTIMNDWSARDVQREEMRAGLGPAKGKDFATSLGPWIVTPDELASSATGRPGVYDLSMTAHINGVERSRGNWKDLHFSFGELLARASQSVTLLPGDVIASGTVGSGCLLELTAGKGPWLKPGDRVSLEIERLGVLMNQVADCVF